VTAWLLWNYGYRTTPARARLQNASLSSRGYNNTFSCSRRTQADAPANTPSPAVRFLGFYRGLND